MRSSRKVDEKKRGVDEIYLSANENLADGGLNLANAGKF
jgi:hypothetical protein